MKRILIILVTAIGIGLLAIFLTMKGLKMIQEQTALETLRALSGKEDEDNIEKKRRWEQEDGFQQELQKYPMIGGCVGVVLGALVGIWLAARVEARRREKESMKVHRNPQWKVPTPYGQQPVRSVESNVIKTKTTK